MKIHIEAERDFHNRRVANDDNREAQIKYYWAIEPAASRYWTMVKNHAAGASVLEYGCYTGERSNELFSIAASIHAIDISDVAISGASEKYASKNVHFHVMDAMNMVFEDGKFDLVFGSGIIHHLETDRSMKEIARVLKPYGVAIFWEPLGLNSAINTYRYFTPSARTRDEHPLLPSDFRIIRSCFGHIDVEFVGLTSLVSVPFRRKVFGNSLRRVFTKVDGAVLSIPGIRFLAWYSLIKLTK